MIDKLRSIGVFATVVDQGTFRAAAVHLGLSPSRVSETVSELERELGVTLLYRSTRQLSLSQEGRLLYDRAQDMLRAAEQGLDSLSQSSSAPAGVLSVTMPAFTAQTALMGSVAAFSRAYPKVRLEIDFSDSPRDLIGDGYDVGIRAGWLKDSELLTRNIGYVDRVLVASPAYAAARPTPQAPSDLEDWDWVRFAMRSNQSDLITKDGQATRVTGRSNLTVNSASALYEFAVQGIGVTAIPENLARRGFDQGDLVHILPQWSLRPLGLHAVWPGQSRRENLTLMFVRFLADAEADADPRSAPPD